MAKSKGCAGKSQNKPQKQVGASENGATQQKPGKKSGASAIQSTQLKPVSKKGKNVKPAAPPQELVADDGSDDMGEMDDEYGSDLDPENVLEMVDAADSVEDDSDAEDDEEVRHASS